MYKSFILPIFDYADIIWDGRTESLSNKLEALHLEALRIIVGGVHGTSRVKLYEESGFCPSKERRERHKLIMCHKMVNNNCPSYIADMLPPLPPPKIIYNQTVINTADPSNVLFPDTKQTFSINLLFLLQPDFGTQYQKTFKRCHL